VKLGDFGLAGKTASHKKKESGEKDFFNVDDLSYGDSKENTELTGTSNYYYYYYDIITCYY
jgi:hypothetical protein